MNRTSSSKALLGGVLALVVLLGAYLMVWRPRATELSTVASERDAMAQELSDLEAAAAAPAPPVPPSPETAALAAAVPADAQLPNLLRQLSTIAGETGVVQRTVTPSVPAVIAGNPGASVTLTVSATGSRSAAVEYVRRLGALDRVFVVDKVTLNEGADVDPTVDPTATQGAVDLELVGRVFTTTAVPSDAG